MTSAKGYAVELRPLSGEEGSGWLATVPDLPGCVSDGESPDEALLHIDDAIEQWLEAARRRGRKIPAPSQSATA